MQYSKHFKPQQQQSYSLLQHFGTSIVEEDNMSSHGSQCNPAFLDCRCNFRIVLFHFSFYFSFYIYPHRSDSLLTKLRVWSSKLILAYQLFLTPVQITCSPFNKQLFTQDASVLVSLCGWLLDVGEELDGRLTMMTKWSLGLIDWWPQEPYSNMTEIGRAHVWTPVT